MRYLALFASILSGLQSIATATAAPPLASVTTPECPKRAGTREFTSETVQFGADRAVIVATSRRQGDTCEITSVLHLRHARTSYAFTLSSGGAETDAIVDFGVDRSGLLLSRETSRNFPNEQQRNAQIATLTIVSGKIRWRNVWDIFGWADCDASVQPEGFTADGKIVVEARASTLIPARRRSCVTDPTVYETDLDRGTATPLPEATTVERHARVVRPPSRNCASDPDLAGACFNVHGRLSYWNGSVTTRLWWIGTKRILGVPDDIVPPAVASRLDWNSNAYGDYRVCPLTPQKPRVMQMVCIESAEHVTYSSR
ncbi:MAG TPA: hypothetical protein VEI03_14125 [Stellaceae bacterium]|nr:hypothetical protein [Stellaceae bacterium]